MAKRRRLRAESKPRPDASQPSIPTPYADQEQKALRLFDQGAYQEAERICRNLLQINQTSVGIYTCLAGICSRTNRSDEGITYLNLANALNSDGSDAPISTIPTDHRSESDEDLLRQGKLNTALTTYPVAFSFQPEHPLALISLGTECLDKGEFDKAMSCYNKVLETWPNHTDTLYNLGIIFNRKRQHELAIDLFQRVLSLEPGHQNAQVNLAKVLYDYGDLDGAADLNRKLIASCPDATMAHHNYSQILLSRGHYKQGWEEYEWRSILLGTNDAMSRNARPIWDPNLDVETLALWPEQGIGDMMLFYSMLDDAKALARRLVVPTDPRLLPLLARSMPEIEFIDSNSPVLETNFDAQLPIGSLGRYLRGSIGDFPLDRSGYLYSDPQRRRQIRSSLNRMGHRLVGISWRSSSSRDVLNRPVDTGAAKTIPLASLAPVLAQEGIRLVSLQYGDVEDEIKALKDSTGIDVLRCEDVDPLLDLDGLAALISACDLVITTSSTTAHLAGALGGATWVLVPMVPFWYWGVDAETTPWYPCMRLFRQRQLGVWADVLERVGQELCNLG